MPYFTITLAALHCYCHKSFPPCRLQTSAPGQEPIQELARIITSSKQLKREVKATDSDVVLAEEGDTWIIESTEGSNLKAILATSLGQLPVLTPIVPIFESPEQCKHPLRGQVKLSLDVGSGHGGRFLWEFDEQSTGDITITVPQDRVPADLGIPSGGRVYLAYEGQTVIWQAAGPLEGQIPANASWTIRKVCVAVGALDISPPGLQVWCLGAPPLRCGTQQRLLC